MIWDTLKGKILFVFSDPAGAKAILALFCYLKRKLLLSSELIVSDREYNFFSDFGADVMFYRENDEKQLVSSFQPDWVVTGTSYTSKIELRFMAEATRSNIKTIAFIDHWTNFSLRFQRNERQVLPDQIWVIDGEAKKMASAEGLPQDKIIVASNPYYDFLKNWRPVISKEVFYESTGIPSNVKVILYAPEPLSQVNGKERFGFDELDVLERIITEMPEHFWSDKRNYLLIKLHPNQIEGPVEAVVNKHIQSRNIKILERNVHTNTLIAYSDTVLGIFSNLLLEARILGIKVFRFLPFPVKEDILRSEKDQLPVIKDLSVLFDKEYAR